MTDEADMTGRLDIARTLAIRWREREREKVFLTYVVLFSRDLPAPDSAAGHIIRVTAGASRLAPSPESAIRCILEQPTEVIVIRENMLIS